MSERHVSRVLSRLQPADHFCWLYSHEAELSAALYACLRAAAGQRALASLLVPSPAARELASSLSQQPPQGPASQVHCLDEGCSAFDLRARVQALLTQFAGAQPPSWLVADLSAAACEPAEALFAWLQGLWQEAAARSLVLVGLYDRRRVAPELLFQLLRGHELLACQEEVYVNEGATLEPPCVTLPDANIRVDRFIAGLRRWTHMRCELERRVEELGAFQAIARAVNRSLSPAAIMQAALDQVMALTHAELGHVTLWDPRAQRPLSFTLQGASARLARELEGCPGTVELAAEVMARGGLLLVDDIGASPLRRLIPEPVLREGYTSFLFMALRSHSNVQGDLCLAARETRHFQPEEAALLEALAEQIGMALENARLYTEAQQRAEEMSSLHDLSLAAASLDPEDVLHLIGERIVRLLHAATSLVALADEEHDELFVAYIQDRGQARAPFTVRLSEQGGLTGYVVRTAEPLLIPDLAAAANLPATPVHFGQAARSWLGVPLLSKGRAMGVICVQDYGPAAFDEDDQRLLSLLAQQAASALESARLFQQTLALERRYRTLLEEMNDGYAVFQDGCLVFANARLGRMLGYSREVLQASSLAELHAPEERAKGAISSGRLDGSGVASQHYRTRFLRGDGSLLPVEVTLNRIEYEGQPALAVLCRDISSQAQMEAQLLQAEKLSAVGQLVAGVAHELNNPLTTIKGYAQLMQGERLPAPVVEDLRKVEEAADRCRRIVGDLLTFARHYEPDLTDTDVNELLQRTVALRSYELRVHNITVQWDLDPQLPVIRADSHRLQRVILNLIFNAEQALLSAKDKGLIRVRSERSPDGRRIRFAVADDGPGIRPEHLDRIFDPFFTTKQVGTGTGLGLSISYGIVKEHGGRIWAESQFGAGATFVVELPLAPAENPLAAADEQGK